MGVSKKNKSSTATPKSTKLGTKIFLSVLAIVLGIILTVQIISFIVTDNKMHELQIELIESNAKVAGSTVREMLHANYLLLETIEDDDYVKNLDFDNLYEPFSYVLKNNSDVASILLASAQTDELFLLKKEGDSLIAYDQEINYYAKDETWYLDAMASGTTTMTDPYLNDSGNYTVSISRPVRDRYYSVIGVVTIDLFIEHLHDLFDTIEAGETGYAFLLDQQGNIIYHPDQSVIMKNASHFQGDLHDISDQMLKGEAGNEFIKIDSENYLAVYRPVEIGDWSLALLVPVKELEAVSIYIIKVSLALTLVALALTFVFAAIMSRSITRPLNIVQTQLEEIARGRADLTRRLDVTSKDEIGRLAKSYNRFMERLAGIFERVRESAHEVNEGTSLVAAATDQQADTNEQIAMIVNQLAQGAVTQSADIQDAKGSIEQLSAAIEQIAMGAQDQALEVSKTAEHTKTMITQLSEVASFVNEVSVKEQENITKSINGREIVTQVAGNMREIKHGIDAAMNNAKILDEGSNQINAIVQVINEVADQTNLLALNAAIEAARAGEHGKGFAVVADEVRVLSDRVRSSSNEIGAIIQTLIKAVESTVSSVQESTQQIIQGNALVIRAQKALYEIMISAQESGKSLEKTSALSTELVDSSQMVDEAMSSIIAIAEENSAASEQMSANSNEVLRLMESIAAISEENAASAEEVAASSEEQSATAMEVSDSTNSLNDTAMQLERLVGLFKTSATIPDKK